MNNFGLEPVYTNAQHCLAELELVTNSWILTKLHWFKADQTEATQDTAKLWPSEVMELSDRGHHYILCIYKVLEQVPP